ncbi:phosphoribosylformylglycinamidine synthase subunit PurS [Membranihabitans maritimus]|uniref:phosphoribosylformylglycinamidine synthase subunit PurS n=1 Tax=Membranihabitans maritimus TaxID=2904244 RepID=UPI001F3E9A24|nr:phosphoribosylformylglycinamidine synthase subunit PurS [Membranihabitans maritimus]
MKFTAEIQIMPHEELLDPQGKTVTKNLPNIGINSIENVRIGKHIELTVEADDEESAKAIVDTACKKLLANTIMEKYEFKLLEIA